MKLILLGTVHRDPSGKSRLSRAMREAAPSAVSLEVSPASVRLRKEHGRRWMRLFKEGLYDAAEELKTPAGKLMKKAGIRGVFEYIRLPYEYRAAIQFARHNNIPLFLLDDSQQAEFFLGRVESEILTHRNLSQLALHDDGDGLDREVSSQYVRARTMVLRPGPGPGPLVRDVEEWRKREALLAQKLRLLHQGLTRRKGRTLDGRELADGLVIAPEAVEFIPETVCFPEDPVHLYVGGWEHLTETEEEHDMYSHLKDLTPEKRLCL